jgi:toxin-antitoxin system PIN domain toxin
LILPDVNPLIYSFRNDSIDHERYRCWLSSVVEGEAVFGISPQVMSSVLRMATNPRIYRDPAPVTRAVEFANRLMDQPHCQIVQPGPRHWKIFCQLCSDVEARGNLVQDAWFAALAIESGCEWITLDRDYSRFPGLRWRTPF